MNTKSYLVSPSKSLANSDVTAVKCCYFLNDATDEKPTTIKCKLQEQSSNKPAMQADTF